MNRLTVIGGHLNKNVTSEEMRKQLEQQALYIRPTANEGVIPDVSTLPLPPIAKAANGFFPSFPEMLQHAKELGGIFSYEIIGRNRITIVADPEIMEIVFAPHDMGMTPGIGDAVRVEMDKLAHAWFQIPLKMAQDHTISSLLSVRRTIGPAKVTPLADQVGAGLVDFFEEMGKEGVIDSVKLAHGTFWPVNQAMFGEKTINFKDNTGAPDWFHRFDESIPMATMGMGISEDSLDGANSITDMFEVAIKKGNHMDAQNCPVLHARLNVDGIPEKYSDRDMARFMLSLMWAPQGNTLSVTWWTIVEIMRDPEIQRKVEKEVRETSQFRYAPINGHFPAEDDSLPYTRACMYEVLRLYIANLTHRKIARDIPVKCGDKWYKVPKDDMMSVASYVRHYNPDVFPEPEKFNPDRWLNGPKPSMNDFFPFAHGKYSCSGKFIAMLEIPILVGLFFRDFDASLMGPIPEADWQNVVASVRPEGWPYHVGLNIRYKKRDRFSLSKN